MGLLDVVKSPERRFLDLVAAEVRKRDPKMFYWPDRETNWRLLRNDGASLGLGMLYGDWKGGSPTKQAEVMARIVDQAVAPRGAIPRQWAMDWTLPVIRRRTFAGVPPISAAVSRPVCGELITALVVATPRGSALVDETLLGQWGITFDDLFAKALDRFRAERWLTLRDSVYFRGGAVMAPNLYSASHILLPELFRPRWVHGQPVMIVPNLHCIALADSEDPGAMSELAKMAGPHQKGEVPPLCFAPMTLAEDDQWILLDTTDPRFAVLAPLTELERQLSAEPPESEWIADPI